MSIMIAINTLRLLDAYMRKDPVSSLTQATRLQGMTQAVYDVQALLAHCHHKPQTLLFIDGQASTLKDLFAAAARAVPADDVAVMLQPSPCDPALRQLRNDLCAASLIEPPVETGRAIDIAMVVAHDYATTATNRRQPPRLQVMQYGQLTAYRAPLAL